MDEPTPTMYPFGMSCKEFTGENGGVSFSQFYFISTGCKEDSFVLSITWAFIIIALVGLVFTLAMLFHTLVTTKRMAVPARVATYASVSLASRVVGLLLTLYAVATPIRMYFMTAPLIFMIVAGCVLEFNWLKVMSRTDWSRVEGTKRLQWNWYKTGLIAFCVVFSVGLMATWAIAAPVLRAMGASPRTINIAVWAGFVWFTIWIWVFFALSVVSLRKLSRRLSEMVHRAETSGTGEAPDAVVTLLQKLKVGGWVLGVFIFIAALSMSGLVASLAVHDFNTHNTLMWIYFGMVLGEIAANVAFVYMGVRRRSQFTSTQSRGSTDIKSKTAPGSKMGTQTGISKNNTELSELATMDDYLTKTKEMQSEWNEVTNNAFVPPV